MKKLVAALVSILTLFLLAIPSWAQEIPDAAPTAVACDGPPDLCSQIQELRKQVEGQKAVTDIKVGHTRISAAADKAKSDDAVSQKTGEALVAAASLATILKMVLTLLNSWKGVFSSDRGKAVLKGLTVVVGLAAFTVGNVVLGMTWWQSLILAGGGPGAIVVHELIKLWAVISGKAKYDDAESSSPAAGKAAGLGTVKPS